MFTGIIREIGILKRKTAFAGGIRLQIGARKIRPRIGDSIAVNGVCLTVTKKTTGGFEVEVVPETLSRSNLAHLAKGAELNLEPSLRFGEQVEGHFVMGHVDGIARVLKKERSSRGSVLTIARPPALKRFLQEKGSVAVNGVSLTVARVSLRDFTVALIPYTEQHTNLGNLVSGDFVNIEIDPLARYRTSSGALKNAAGRKIAVIVSEFNRDFGEKLLSGALQTLRKAGVKPSSLTIVRVPGAFEIPWACLRLAASKQFRGMIALGCVIQGQTDHYKAVCEGVTYGVQQAALVTGIPIMFGVLMCKSEKQALERASADLKKNKGAECARALLACLRAFP